MALENLPTGISKEYLMSKLSSPRQHNFYKISTTTTHSHTQRGDLKRQENPLESTFVGRLFQLAKEVILGNLVDPSLKLNFLAGKFTPHTMVHTLEIFKLNYQNKKYILEALIIQ